MRFSTYFLVALLGAPFAVHAQAGPPFLTNDPGTPGNANWEINMPARKRSAEASRLIRCRKAT